MEESVVRTMSKRTVRSQQISEEGRWEQQQRLELRTEEEEVVVTRRGAESEPVFRTPEQKKFTDLEWRYRYL